VENPKLKEICQAQRKDAPPVFDNCVFGTDGVLNGEFKKINHQQKKISREN
jgi:hypothetical protein